MISDTFFGAETQRNQRLAPAEPHSWRCRRGSLRTLVAYLEAIPDDPATSAADLQMFLDLIVEARRNPREVDEQVFVHDSERRDSRRI